MPVISNSRVSTIPAGLELSAGRLDNASLANTSGLNPTVGASLETVHLPGGIINRLSAAEQLKVSSTDANDKNAGSGAARRVRITGLGSDGAYLTEDLNLDGSNGTTQVTTTNSCCKSL